MKDKYYYSGGLAETVYEPSELTYSFFSRWFAGNSSLGKAMELLGLPYEKIMEPILVMEGDDMWVDLKAEEKTLYGKTVFSYLPVKGNNQPGLTINVLKIFNPFCIAGTIKILARQSMWLADTKGVEEMIAKWKNEIEKKDVPMTISDCDEVLANTVWPRVIACGMLAEYFMKVVESSDKNGVYQKYLMKRAAERDWFFRSLTDMDKVKHGQWSIFEYIKIYGMRADKDYELISPRWHENKTGLLEKIRMMKHLEHTEVDFKDEALENGNKYLKITLDLLIARSDMRREALRFMNGLRKALLFRGEIKIGLTKKKKKAEKQMPRMSSGQGMIGERGVVSGPVFMVTSSGDTLPKGAIGIFPNASPEFSVLYPQCKGIIFLHGGMTSHGVIVAREYKIPAIIDEAAGGVENGVVVEVNGDTGVWKVVE